MTTNRESAVEILIQIRDDLRGLTATNAGLAKMRENMGATARAAKQNASAIASDYGRLADGIKNKFSYKNIGLSILGGLGLTSGFAVAATAIGKITEAYEAHMTKLKQIDDTWKDIIAKSKEYQRSLLDPKQTVAVLEQDLLELQRKYQEIVGPKKPVTMNIATPGAGMVQSTYTPTWGDSNDVKAVAENLQKQFEVAKQLADARKKLAEENTRASNEEKAALLEVSKLYTQTWASMEKNYLSMLASMNENDFDARRAAIEDMFFAGKIGAEEADRAIKQLDDDYQRWSKNAEQAAIKHLKHWAEVFAMLEDGGRKQAIENNAEEAAKRAARAAEQMGYAFESAFESAILGGEKFSDVLRGLLRDIAQVALRTAITQPLGSAVGGFISSIFAAGGGQFVTNGRTQLTVGDNPGGAELVSVLPLSGVGTTHVSGSAVKMAGGGALLAGAGRLAGDTFNFNYSFASGVSRGEVLALLPDLVEASKRGVLDAQRRRRDGFR